MTMHKPLYLIYDVDRQEGGRGLRTIDGCVDESIQRLDGYIEKLGGRLITATRNNTDNTRINRKILLKENGKKKTKVWTS